MVNYNNIKNIFKKNSSLSIASSAYCFCLVTQPSIGIGIAVDTVSRGSFAIVLWDKLLLFCFYFVEKSLKLTIVFYLQSFCIQI